MIALSVILISSGHTLVQHLVMLQYPMPPVFAQIGDTIRGIERIHLQRGGIDQESRTDELVVHVVIAQHVAHVLAQEALDALAEFLHTIDVGLLHAPGTVGGVGLARHEFLDLFLDLVVPGDVRDQILDEGERLHRLDRDRLIHGQQFSRVMHIRRGFPLISAEHDPHLPALQFHRTARSLACSA